MAVVSTCRLQAEHRLGDDQTYGMLQALLQTRGPMLHWVAWRRRGIHPHLAVDDGHRKGAHIVGERVEGPAAGEIEACMMPVTGQDAIFDSTALQREPHVRAAVVDGIHLTLVVEH